MREYTILTCPRCGDDLASMVYLTVPPLAVKRCLKCGFRYDEPIKVKRVVFDPPKEETK